MSPAGSKTPDVIVVGGGIVGAAVAYHLAREGVRTMVADDARAGHATRAGAGIVCPVTATVGDERLAELAFAAGAYYPTLAGWLTEEAPSPRGTPEPLGGDDNGFSLIGMLSVSLGGDGADLVDATAAWADHTAATTPYEAMTGYRRLTPAEVRNLCPLVPEAIGPGIFLKWGARVDGDNFRHSLLRAAKGRGVDVRSTRVQNVEGHLRGASVIADGSPVEAGWVVVCTGAWTNRVLPDGPAVHASRGEITHVAGEDLDTASWPLVEFEGTGPYLVPWAGGRFAVGATVEPTDDFDARPTLRGLRWTLDALDRATGGTANGRSGALKFVECRVGFRPMTADGLPVIGPVSGSPRVLVATGHGANGLSWGPFTGRIVADLVAGRPPSIDLAPFSPVRQTAKGTAVPPRVSSRPPASETAPAGESRPAYAHSRARPA
jgi:D-amino-acid dehydrogenase